MRFVAVAALAATFWLSVATLRLMTHGGGCTIRHAPPARVSDARIERPPPSFQIESIPVRPGLLTKADVAADMEALEQEMTDCEDLGFRGLAVVDLVIGPRGWVRSADVRGKLIGTPVGRCVEAHLYATRFAPSEAGLKTSQAFRVY